MTIEIHRPELEAIILKQMETGRFENVEEVLLDAMRSAHTPVSNGRAGWRRAGLDVPANRPKLTISEVFAAARGLAEDLDVTRDPEIARPIDLS